MQQCRALLSVWLTTVFWFRRMEVSENLLKKANLTMDDWMFIINRLIYFHSLDNFQVILLLFQLDQTGGERGGQHSNVKMVPQTFP